jgi:hypothetical protein
VLLDTKTAALGLPPMRAWEDALGWYLEQRPGDPAISGNSPCGAIGVVLGSERDSWGTSTKVQLDLWLGNPYAFGHSRFLRALSRFASCVRGTSVCV